MGHGDRGSFKTAVVRFESMGLSNDLKVLGMMGVVERDRLLEELHLSICLFQQMKTG